MTFLTNFAWHFGAGLSRTAGRGASSLPPSSSPSSSPWLSSPSSSLQNLSTEESSPTSDEDELLEEEEEEEEEEELDGKRLEKTRKMGNISFMGIIAIMDCLSSPPDLSPPDP